MKFGFKKKIIEEKFYFNLSLFKFTNDEFKIVKTDYMGSQIQIVVNKKKENFIIIKGIITKRKGVKCFKILSLNNSNAFKNNFNTIINLISKKHKVYFFSEYILSQNDSFFPRSNFMSFTKKRDIYIKSVLNIDKSDLLNSDLAF